MQDFDRPSGKCVVSVNEKTRGVTKNGHTCQPGRSIEQKKSPSKTATSPSSDHKIIYFDSKAIREAKRSIPESILLPDTNLLYSSYLHSRLPTAMDYAPGDGESNSKSARVQPLIPRTDFPQERRDIYHVAFLLRQVLVPDLVPYILDLAEYWMVESEHSDKEVHAFASSKQIQKKPCMTLPSLSKLDLPRIRKVVFTIQGKDQGWSSYPENHGTYDNCHSWFEAVLPAPDGETEKRKLLRENMHAGESFEIHEIVWRAGDDDENVRECFDELTSGRDLTVEALAQFPGWRCRFKSGRIDVYIAAVVRL